jgi:hypothetical protein
VSRSLGRSDTGSNGGGNAVLRLTLPSSRIAVLTLTGSRLFTRCPMNSPRRFTRSDDRSIATRPRAIAGPGLSLVPLNDRLDVLQYPFKPTIAHVLIGLSVEISSHASNDLRC